MTSATLILPFVWATELMSLAPPASGRTETEPAEMAYYRKYTEAILRRYLRLSMEVGKVSSLLGQEMFRGKVTSYRVGGFDDVVIFVHDVKRCLERLDEEQHSLILRMAVQQYTVTETAELIGLKPRTVIRRYGLALDCLTRIFLSVHMLEPQNCCQGGWEGDSGVTH